MRLSLGTMLVIHAWNKVAGQGGLAGTAQWFEALGMRPGRLHARLAALTEATAGVLMIAGLIQPLSSAAFIGLMAVAALTDHRGKGFFVFRGGWEYVALVGVFAAALASTGPGRLSLDHRLGWGWSGQASMLTAVIVGLTFATFLVVTARRETRQGVPS
ncbi:DoxX family protein [Nocardioides sp. AN3]